MSLMNLSRPRSELVSCSLNWTQLNNKNSFPHLDIAWREFPFYWHWINIVIGAEGLWRNGYDVLHFRIHTFRNGISCTVIGQRTYWILNGLHYHLLEDKGPREKIRGATKIKYHIVGLLNVITFIINKSINNVKWFDW